MVGNPLVLEICEDTKADGKAAAMIDRPQSPCVAVCALNSRAGLCTGCGRTIAEIGEWGGASAERQCAILALLPERMVRLSAGQQVIGGNNTPRHLAAARP